MNDRADELAWWGKGPAPFSRLHEGGDGTTAAVATVDFAARVAARKAAATESRRCLELAVAGGSPTPPAKLAAVIGERVKTSYLPLPPAGWAGSGRRCEVWCGAAAG